MGPYDFARDIREALNARRAITRRLSSIRALCGRQKLSDSFLAELDSALAKHGVHTDRQLGDRANLPSQVIRFSLEPIAPGEVGFGCERQLVDMVADAIGHVPPFEGLAVRDREHRLTSGKRVDLLCHQRDRGGKGAIIAVELKRARAGGEALGQLAEYLEELSSHPVAKGRELRGILLAKQFSPVTLAMAAKSHWPITCLRYNMAFERVAEPKAQTI